VAKEQARNLAADTGERLAMLGVLANARREDGDLAGARELDELVRETHLARAAAAGTDASDLLATAAFLLDANEPGDAARALEIVQRAVSEHPDGEPHAQELLARGQHALGNAQRARAILVEMLDALSGTDTRRTPLEERLASWADG
jgi:hypothetical protein